MTSLSTHQLTPPNFSIITLHEGTGESHDLLFPSVASLADQEGTKIEQILQHTGGVSNLWNKLSRELSLSKRSPRYTLRLLEEKKEAYSELLQRGLVRATGTLLGFLQPEEQYLPHTLIAVEKYFAAHPEIDVLITGCFLKETSKAQGATPLSLEYVWTAAPAIRPSTLFLRASLLKQGFPLQTEGEESLLFTEWLLRLLRGGKKVGALSMPTTFSPTSLKEGSAAGKKAISSTAPFFMRQLAPWWQWRHHKALQKATAHLPAATPGALYAPDSLLQRREPTP